MNLKRILAVILALTIAAGLAGCYGGSGGNEEPAPTPQSTEASTSTPAPTVEPTEAPAEQVEETAESSGPEFKTLRMLISESTYGAEYGFNTGIEKIALFEEALNMKFDMEVVPRGDYSDVLELRFATGTDLPDVIAGTGLWDGDVYSWAMQGHILRLNDLIDEYPSINQRYTYDYPTMRNWLADANGDIYWLKRIDYAEGWDIQPFVYRRDWLEKIGMNSVPSTTEDLYQYLKLCQEMDINGNGIKDEALIVDGWWSLFWPLSPAFGEILSFEPVWSYKEGEGAHIAWISQGGKEFLTYLNKLYTEGLLWKRTPSFGAPDEANESDYSEFWASNAVSATVTYPYNAKNSLLDYTPGVDGIVYDIMPPLIGPSGGKPGYFLEGTSPAESKKYVVPSGADVEAAMRYYDFFMSEEGSTLQNWGVEGVQYFVNQQGLKQLTPEWEAQILDDPTVDWKFGNLYFGPSWQQTKLDQTMLTWVKADEEFKNNVRAFKSGAVAFEMPAFFGSSPQQQETIDLYNDDIVDYIQDMAFMFIRGEESLLNWDDFVATVMSKGYDILQPIYTERWERLHK